MTDRSYTAESHVEALLSGYLDGELTQQVRQQIRLHLDGCDECRATLQDLEALRRRMGQARLSLAGKDQWREKMSDTTGRAIQGTGWVLLLGALLIIFGIGAFTFLTDPGAALFWKLLVSALYLGLGALFVSVLRQRLMERKSDKYKDVEI